MNRHVLSLALAFSATVGLVVACSSSDEAAPTRTVTPAPTGGVDSGIPETPDAAACFEGEPAALDQFYNKCTDGQCAPFDNAARLPLFERGKPLPPLP